VDIVEVIKENITGSWIREVTKQSSA